jgi:hypothetical protein
MRRQAEAGAGQWLGQAASPVAPLSHASPGSITPSPHTAGQSVSVARVPPAGQQPSPETSDVIAACEQLALHAIPFSESTVQGFPSSHDVGQPPLLAGSPGSQVSPASSSPFPQATGQSTSTVLQAPTGQQPSLSMPDCVTTGACRHTAAQVDAEMTDRSCGDRRRRGQSPTGHVR